MGRAQRLHLCSPLLRGLRQRAKANPAKWQDPVSDEENKKWALDSVTRPLALSKLLSLLLALHRCGSYQSALRCPNPGDGGPALLDITLTESVEILSLGVTLQVIEELAEQNGGAHSAVGCHCKFPGRVLQGAPHLQDLFQT